MQVITIPCSFDNYSYLILCEQSGEAAIVDPTESFPVLRRVEEYKANLTTVLCTHHHNDHVGDIGQLLEDFPDLQVYCHSSDKGRIAHANCFVEDGMSIKVGEIEGKVLHTPGHTLGSSCFYFEKALFTGDTLFGAGCGRLFEGTAEQMYASLNNRIAPLSDETQLFFGHEYTKKNLEFAQSVEAQNSDITQRMNALKATASVTTPSTVILEKRTNPFLRCDSENIRKDLVLRGLQVQEAVQVFTALRDLRNSF